MTRVGLVSGRFPFLSPVFADRFLTFQTESRKKRLSVLPQFSLRYHRSYPRLQYCLNISLLPRRLLINDCSVWREKRKTKQVEIECLKVVNCYWNDRGDTWEDGELSGIE